MLNHLKWETHETRRSNLQLTVLFKMLRGLIDIPPTNHYLTPAYADPEGGDRGSGPPPPLKNHKNIGFLRNTGPGLLKSQGYQASIQCWAIIGPPGKCHLNGVSLAGRWWSANSGILILPLLIKLKKMDPPSDKTFWIRAWPASLRIRKSNLHILLQYSTSTDCFKNSFPPGQYQFGTNYQQQ